MITLPHVCRVSATQADIVNLVIVITVTGIAKTVIAIHKPQGSALDDGEYCNVYLKQDQNNTVVSVSLC